MPLISCYRCQNKWEFTSPMARRETCEACGWDARCCKNCKFYDRNAHHECRENQAEFVPDKEKANFCSYFEANADSKGGTTEADHAKSQLDALFGNSDENSDSAKPVSSIEQQLKDFMSKK